MNYIKMSVVMVIFVGYESLVVLATHYRPLRPAIIPSSARSDARKPLKKATAKDLCEASAAGNLEAVNYLLGLGVKPRGRHGKGPLAFAAENGHDKVVERLLKVPGNNIEQALCLAVKGGHLAVVEILLANLRNSIHKADYDAMCSRLLHLAVKSGCAAMVKRLLAIPGIDINAADPDIRWNNWTPLHSAAMYGRVAVVAALLADSRTKVTLDRETPLHIAVQYGRVAVIKLLLADSRTEVDAPGFDGKTPLHYAVLRGNVEAVDLLLRAGADAHRPSVSGETPITCASAHGHSKILELLLTPQFEVNSPLVEQFSSSSNYHEPVKHPCTLERERQDREFAQAEQQNQKQEEEMRRAAEYAQAQNEKVRQDAELARANELYVCVNRPRCFVTNRLIDFDATILQCTKCGKIVGVAGARLMKIQLGTKECLCGGVCDFKEKKVVQENGSTVASGEPQRRAKRSQPEEGVSSSSSSSSCVVDDEEDGASSSYSSDRSRRQRRN